MSIRVHSTCLIVTIIKNQHVRRALDDYKPE